MQHLQAVLKEEKCSGVENHLQQRNILNWKLCSKISTSHHCLSIIASVKIIRKQEQHGHSKWKHIPQCKMNFSCLSKINTFTNMDTDLLLCIFRGVRWWKGIDKMWPCRFYSCSLNDGHKLLWEMRIVICSMEKINEIASLYWGINGISIA